MIEIKKVTSKEIRKYLKLEANEFNRVIQNAEKNGGVTFKVIKDSPLTYQFDVDDIVLLAENVYKREQKWALCKCVFHFFKIYCYVAENKDGSTSIKKCSKPTYYRYKNAYAQMLLVKEKIQATDYKNTVEIAHSTGTNLYVLNSICKSLWKDEDVPAEDVVRIFAENDWRGGSKCRAYNLSEKGLELLIDKCNKYASDLQEYKNNWVNKDRDWGFIEREEEEGEEYCEGTCDCRIIDEDEDEDEEEDWL